ncbi:uncharacterized protein LOC143240484 isoform X2 [Tachypleus tridentatus]|uniref:uncharacterized protein LOC143240484 isoform X2 n=1 Tax=Tachypleus tridentatus TaxID=6853 RepID=UPI003FD536EB
MFYTASRNVSKCGYLFVAPDFDFSIPVNRTKRWQRRWFVLYDDGEFTYSVDEHPDTVPQAVIDMNKALEVSDGENVTGNQFSIAIATPDKVHFIKGTSKEERNWWFDILSRFPSNAIRGRNKRFATIPGGKATVTDLGNQRDKKSDISSDLIRSASTRERYNTFSSKFPSQPKPEPSWEQVRKAETEDVISTKESDKLILKNNLHSTPIKKTTVINNRMKSDNTIEWKHIESKNLRNILSNSGSISYPPSVEKDTKTKKCLQVEEVSNQDNKPEENTDKGKPGVRRYLKRDG